MIEFQHVELSYQNKSVLRGIDLTIEDGEFVALIGASGCGKTTLLKLINRLHAPKTGRVLIDGEDVARMPLKGLPARIGYVVQDAGLFPHMTVRENIALALELAGTPKEEIEPRVSEMLRMTALDPAAYGDLLPSELSGGQRQRAGIARAFAPNPSILLMDEPFSALDPLTREALQDEVKRLQQTYKKTVVFVTHDMAEALKLADRIAVLEDGRIAQFASPEEILKHPADEAIAAFVGAEKTRRGAELLTAQAMMATALPRIGTDAAAFAAKRVMKQAETDYAFVVDDLGRLSGILRAEDLSWKTWPNTLASSLAKPAEITVLATDSLKDIALSGAGRGPFPIPVLDAAGILRGMITREALLTELARQTSAPYAEEADAPERSAESDASPDLSRCGGEAA